MDSEIELNNAISELNMVAASPELYPLFIQGYHASSSSSGSRNEDNINNLSQSVHNNGLLTLLSLITHENTDVSLSVLSLFQEMIDQEVLESVPEANLFLQAFISTEYQALELLVQNLSRLNDSPSSTQVSSSNTKTIETNTLEMGNEEDAQGIYNTMSIFENLINIFHDIDTDTDSEYNLVDDICRRTNLLHYLIHKLLEKKPFDANKLYFSELLSILLQYSTNQLNAKKFCMLPDSDGDGMDMLLQCIAYYRKREPQSSDEQVASVDVCIVSVYLL